MAIITIIGQELEIEIEGIRKLGALKSKLDIPLSTITEVVTGEAAKAYYPAALAKVYGTNVPGGYTGGLFLSKEGRVFCDFDKQKPALVLLLAHDTYQAVVVQVEDPEATASKIRATLS